MFVNISNHPSSKWSSAQVEAAKRLGGEIVDIEFPNVPPDATSADVEKMAKDITQKVLSLQTKSPFITAMVQGEHTLTVALVKELMYYGIQCVAATSERLVTENPDGTKTVKFEFKQFRNYY
ncbi:MAG: hypothetical protein QXS54_09360 [Candidatus Methanomethylicaceae archaeon]